MSRCEDDQYIPNLSKQLLEYIGDDDDRVRSAAVSSLVSFGKK
ncbi:hypothetical protein FRUB_03887 [Fimbriiglobus ruber]|uniref:Uncharacterized protein n=2 Tax=Fimbriiglobus ruber TaxID=1908690 RepID=A0A225DX86_9BACT|nr:hypothetical protein FRUB_03887 [Fimbriiglobus ruber]